MRLAKYFGTSPEAWMELQADYELRVAARLVGPDVERSVDTRAT